MASYDYVYEGDHSINFWRYERSGSGWALSNTRRNTWSTYDLIPLVRPSIAIPKANYSIVQIPGTNARLDMTDYLPGGITYNNRNGNWTFAAPVTEFFPNWAERYESLKQYFNGSRFVVELTDDPGVYYEGRITVVSYDPGNSYSTVTISYDLDANPRSTRTP